MIKALFSSMSVFAIALFATFASNAFADPPDVNCNTEDAEALQDAIDNASVGDEIVVIGDCAGVSYVITTDRLTLTGQGNASITGDGTAPAILIFSNLVTIKGWNLIDGGAHNGISLNKSGSATVRDIKEITGEDGVTVIHSSYVEIFDVDLIHADDVGILAGNNASARIIGTVISGNGRDGVHVVAGGFAVLGGGNTIINNVRHGVFAGGSHVRFTGANIWSTYWADSRASLMTNHKWVRIGTRYPIPSALTILT